MYTPELLALAVSLADRPFDPAMPCKGEARSRTCGSHLRLSCELDRAGKIDQLGLQVSACAVGQAAAAIFAAGAKGLDRPALTDARAALIGWLGGDAAPPRWPGIAALAPAREHPARHSAILLAWDAALAALSKEPVRS